MVKKDVKSKLINYYHDNKQVVNSDLKDLNTYAKDITKGV